MLEKQDILEYLQHSVGQPITEKDLLKRLHIDSDDRHAVKKLLRELMAGGEIVEVRSKKIALPGQVGLVVGHVQGHPKGFAFVVSKQKGISDVFISPEDLNNAFHGDLVVARIQRKGKGKSAEGKVLRILQRGQNRVIGIYHDHGHYGLVIPQDTKLPYKIHIDAANARDAREHQIVVVQILQHDEFHRNPDGEVVQVLGYPYTPGMDEKIVIHAFGLPTDFPNAVLEEADRALATIPLEDIQHRLDLRDQCIFTIDGENARDFDDAVSIERLENGHYSLGVHIADVNHYVREGSPLDQEAYQRGTSVYFPDRAIPMFPERLSNQICSLRQGEDRLTISVIMEFDPTMKLVNYDIQESVICSKARLTYTAVRQMLKDQDEALREQYASLLPSLELMKELSELLLQKRMRRGSLDFDLPEPELVLDIQGNVENIIKAERNLAHRLIEEFMLAANETVASHLTWLQIPMMYRTHEKPDESKIASLNTFIGSLGLKLRPGAQLHSKDIQKLLRQVKHKPMEHVVNYLTLRSLKQARYTVQNSGHFGLASTCYTHFTSPIRRYPDLIVHRILKAVLRGEGFSEQAQEQRRKYLETIADHSSIRERLAADAERDIVLVKKLRFMEDKLGDLFDGVISGVAAFGIFVELRDYFVEGFIHITTLHDDYYRYHEESYSLVGEEFRKRYRVGDRLRVQVTHVDVAKRQIDFLMV